MVKHHVVTASGSVAVIISFVVEGVVGIRLAMRFQYAVLAVKDVGLPANDVSQLRKRLHSSCTGDVRRQAFAGTGRSKDGEIPAWYAVLRLQSWQRVSKGEREPTSQSCLSNSRDAEPPVSLSVCGNHK